MYQPHQHLPLGLFAHIPSQETGSAASVHVPSIWQCLTAGPVSLKPLWQSKGQAVPTTLEPLVQEGLLMTRCPRWRAGQLTTPEAFTGDGYRQGMTICWFWGWRSWLTVIIAWLSFESLFTLHYLVTACLVDICQERNYTHTNSITLTEMYENTVRPPIDFQPPQYLKL